MRPSRLIGNLPRVGIEIEISRWMEQSNGTSVEEWEEVRNLKTAGLVQLGLMPDEHQVETFPYHSKFHTWNCSCNSCEGWVNANADPYPVQFALKYDGTLPLTGGEYISTPFSINQRNWQSFFQGWKTITDGAIPDTSVLSKQGPPASPSVHVHASCENQDYNAPTADEFRTTFAPEITLLAGAANIDPRPMKYRSLTGNGNEHHKYMNIQHMRKFDEDGMPASVNGMYVYSGPHIELRTWEPYYDDDRYIEGAVHATAAIAQLMSSGTFSKKLIGLTYLKPHNRPKLQDNWNMVVAAVVEDYYRMLQHALNTVTYLVNDYDAANAVNWLFDEAAERWL